jgi:beta-hydroxylase
VRADEFEGSKGAGVKKNLKYIALALGVGAPLGYLFPKLTVFYLLCGIYDVARNRPLTWAVAKRYFFGNGVPTWLLSPVNVVMDILTLPYRNKGVYQLADFPSEYQEEIRRLIHVAQQSNLVGQLEQRSGEFPRTMFFFKWYGVNVNTILNVPAFHQRWNYVQTIGVSVFNKKVSTSKHFGPLRVTLRVLYNLNDTTDDSAYIVVGDKTNYWRDNKLFIFDDTLMHQSFNETNKLRYCLFVDIVRPSLLRYVLVSAVGVTSLFARSVNYIFYKQWTVVEQ